MSTLTSKEAYSRDKFDFTDYYNRQRMNNFDQLIDPQSLTIFNGKISKNYFGLYSYEFESDLNTAYVECSICNRDDICSNSTTVYSSCLVPPEYYQDEFYLTVGTCVEKTLSTSVENNCSFPVFKKMIKIMEFDEINLDFLTSVYDKVQSLNYLSNKGSSVLNQYYLFNEKCESSEGYLNFDHLEDNISSAGPYFAKEIVKYLSFDLTREDEKEIFDQINQKIKEIRENPYKIQTPKFSLAVGEQLEIQSPRNFGELLIRRFLDGKGLTQKVLAVSYHGLRFDPTSARAAAVSIDENIHTEKISWKDTFDNIDEFRQLIVKAQKIDKLTRVPVEVHHEQKTSGVSIVQRANFALDGILRRLEDDTDTLENAKQLRENVSLIYEKINNPDPDTAIADLLEELGKYYTLLMDASPDRVPRVDQLFNQNYLVEFKMSNNEIFKETNMLVKELQEISQRISDSSRAAGGGNTEPGLEDQRKQKAEKLKKDFNELYRKNYNSSDEQLKGELSKYKKNLEDLGIIERGISDQIADGIEKAARATNIETVENFIKNLKTTLETGRTTYGEKVKKLTQNLKEIFSDENLRSEFQEIKEEIEGISKNFTMDYSEDFNGPGVKEKFENILLLEQLGLREKPKSIESITAEKPEKFQELIKLKERGDILISPLERKYMLRQKTQELFPTIFEEPSKNFVDILDNLIDHTSKESVTKRVKNMRALVTQAGKVTERGMQYLPFLGNSDGREDIETWQKQVLSLIGQTIEVDQEKNFLQQLTQKKQEFDRIFSNWPPKTFEEANEISQTLQQLVGTWDDKSMTNEFKKWWGIQESALVMHGSGTIWETAGGIFRRGVHLRYDEGQFLHGIIRDNILGNVIKYIGFQNQIIAASKFYPPEVFVKGKQFDIETLENNSEMYNKWAKQKNQTLLDIFSNQDKTIDTKKWRKYNFAINRYNNANDPKLEYLQLTPEDIDNGFKVKTTGKNLGRTLGEKLATSIRYSYLALLPKTVQDSIEINLKQSLGSALEGNLGKGDLKSGVSWQGFNNFDTNSNFTDVYRQYFPEDVGKYFSATGDINFEDPLERPGKAKTLNTPSQASDIIQNPRVSSKSTKLTRNIGALGAIALLSGMIFSQPEGQKLIASNLTQEEEISILDQNLQNIIDTRRISYLRKAFYVGENALGFILYAQILKDIIQHNLFYKNPSCDFLNSLNNNLLDIMKQQKTIYSSLASDLESGRLEDVYVPKK